MRFAETFIKIWRKNEWRKRYAKAVNWGLSTFASRSAASPASLAGAKWDMGSRCGSVTLGVWHHTVVSFKTLAPLRYPPLREPPSPTTSRKNGLIINQLFEVFWREFEGDFPKSPPQERTHLTDKSKFEKGVWWGEGMGLLNVPKNRKSVLFTMTFETKK